MFISGPSIKIETYYRKLKKLSITFSLLFNKRLNKESKMDVYQSRYLNIFLIAITVTMKLYLIRITFI